jgi:hypothetical protein
VGGVRIALPHPCPPWQPAGRARLRAPDCPRKGRRGRAMLDERETEEALERMLDENGSPDPAEMVAAILRRLAAVCGEKEDHVRSTWQDGALAREWRTAGESLENAAHRISVGAKIRPLMV